MKNVFNKNDIDLLQGFGFSKNDIIHLCLEFNYIIMEQIKEYLVFIKKEKESVIEKILKN